MYATGLESTVPTNKVDIIEKRPLLPSIVVGFLSFSCRTWSSGQYQSNTNLQGYVPIFTNHCVGIRLAVNIGKNGDI